MESWIYVSKLADVVSIIGTLITLWQIHRTRLETARIRRELVDERQRKTRTITIVLARNSQPSQPGGQSSLSANQPERRLVLPFTLRRAELTRAEVMGRIGMAQVNQSGRYEPAYFRSKDSLDQINAIAD